MEPFSIIFIKGKGIISKLIRLFSRGKYSHCELIVSDGLHTLSTDWKYSLRVKHLSFRSNEYDVKRLSQPINDEQKQAIIQFYLNELRRGYDYTYLLFRLFFILFRVKIRNDKYRYTCDEVIVAAFEYANIKLIKDGVLLTPQSLSESELLENVNEI